MRTIISLLVLMLLAAGGVYVYINYYQTGLLNQGIELLKPTNKEIKNYLPLGYNLNLPVRILPGFRLGVYADLGGAKPRVLALDPGGVIVASLTGDGRVVALRDKDGDGISDETTDILKGLNRPHGIIFNSGYLYVAESDKV